ncbi:hypothetical protein HUJ04_005974 [Dendroctonus ponderosae]|nr:hypothetical protein HUJ04_005974 [Dendroctonus ponderosae]
MNQCPSVALMLTHLNGEKSLRDFASGELNMLPLDYLIKNTNSFDLLDAWGKLPMNYKGCYELQIKLPCFVHYYRPNWRTHIDGPASSQEKFILVGGPEARWGDQRLGGGLRVGVWVYLCQKYENQII